MLLRQRKPALSSDPATGYIGVLDFGPADAISLGDESDVDAVRARCGGEDILLCAGAAPVRLPVERARVEVYGYYPTPLGAAGGLGFTALPPMVELLAHRDPVPTVGLPRAPGQYRQVVTLTGGPTLVAEVPWWGRKRGTLYLRTTGAGQNQPTLTCYLVGRRYEAHGSDDAQDTQLTEPDVAATERTLHLERDESHSILVYVTVTTPATELTIEATTYGGELV